MNDEWIGLAELAEQFDASEDQIGSLLAIGGFLENFLAGGYPSESATAYLTRIFADAAESPSESTVAASAIGDTYIART